MQENFRTASFHHVKLCDVVQLQDLLGCFVKDNGTISGTTLINSTTGSWEWFEFTKWLCRDLERNEENVSAWRLLVSKIHGEGLFL
jgi:hypothetical protein